MNCQNNRVILNSPYGGIKVGSSFIKNGAEGKEIKGGLIKFDDINNAQVKVPVHWYGKP